jgi:16S rRNA (cytosine1402-N4)-methyltransferase
VSASATWLHTTVLLAEAVDALVTQPGGIYVDGTFGRGGHSTALLARLNANGRLVAFDKDPQALAAAQAITDPRFVCVHASFGDMARELAARGITQVQGVLLDLGVSSPQIDTPERGFSFRFDAPLDMRMDTSKGETAADFLRRADFPLSWRRLSKPANRARTLQRARFKLFGFTSTQSLKRCNKA